MLEKKILKTKSQRIALIAMFSVISIVLDSIITPGFSAGVWFGWIFIMSPVNGLLLGPIDGFITTLLSVMIGHTVVFRESVYEYIFSLGAPIASLITGLIYRQRKSLVTLYFIILLGAYFLSPISRDLPIWGMWDVYLTFFILLTWIEIFLHWRLFLV
jgi:thiamine transporter ThiT